MQNISLVGCSQLSQVCPLPTSFSLPASLPVGWCKESKGLCVSPTQQERKHHCVIKALFSTNVKCGLTLTTVKKINPYSPVHKITITRARADDSSMILIDNILVILMCPFQLRILHDSVIVFSKCSSRIHQLC